MNNKKLIEIKRNKKISVDAALANKYGEWDGEYAPDFGDTHFTAVPDGDYFMNEIATTDSDGFRNRKSTIFISATIKQSDCDSYSAAGKVTYYNYWNTPVRKIGGKLYKL